MSLNFFQQASAKTGFGLNDLFDDIAARLLAKYKEKQKKEKFN